MNLKIAKKDIVKSVKAIISGGIYSIVFATSYLGILIIILILLLISNNFLRFIRHYSTEDLNLTILTFFYPSVAVILSLYGILNKKEPLLYITFLISSITIYNIVFLYAHVFYFMYLQALL